VIAVSLAHPVSLTLSRVASSTSMRTP
jgi:hypothetical protein